MPRGDTKPTIWSVAELAEAVNAATELDDSKKRLKLPQFQRSIVWKSDQQEQLIDSILRGLPVGSLLFAKEKNQDSFLLIDGLQRTTTLIAHQSRELELSSPPEHVVRMVLDALEANVDRSCDERWVTNSLKAWMKATGTTRQADGFTTRTLARHLGELLDPPLELEDIDTLASGLGDTLDELGSAVSIGDYQLPVIIYEGDHTNLPEIFERMNTGGTQLSKYQVYAASWSNHAAVFDDDNIRNAIRSKYQAYLDMEFYVDGLREDGYQDSYNLFEYLFGLGKVLAEKYPLLFPVDSDDADPESFIFSLVALVLGLPASDVSRIPESPWFPQTEGGSYTPRNLRSALEAGCELVNESLQGVVALKLNQSTPKPSHPELLVVSLIARATLEQSAPKEDFAVSTIAGNRRDQLRLAFRHHYLFDQIRRQWRGPTATLATSRVWSRTPKLRNEEFTDDGELSGHYTYPIERADWESALEDWYRQEQLNRLQKERPNVRAIERLFLRYLYAYRLSHADNSDTEFDIEHLYPVDRLTNLVGEDESDGWPISCIANLAILPKGLNRGKRSQTISEYAEERNRAGEPLTDAEVSRLENYIVGGIDSVEIPTVDGEDKLDKSEYIELLNERWSHIRDALLENLLPE